MDLPFRPPLAPMLARLVRELPDDGYLYEPKWDGFRGLVFVGPAAVDIQSRHGRPLERYFPELLHDLAGLPPGTVVDGEIVLPREGRLDFPTLLSRLHPAASRVELLSRSAPAAFVAFDLAALAGRDLRRLPFERRRRELEGALRPTARVRVTPLTADAEVARGWLERFQGAGIDGVVAKRRDLVYQPGKRAMVKVKLERTVDCVVAGFRWAVDRRAVASLLLGLYDGSRLRHVGVASAFPADDRVRMVEALVPLTMPLRGHPWESGFGIGGNPVGRLAGSAGRWEPGMDPDWVPLRPELVCEVAYDQLDDRRFRHPARFRRWRPDRDARSCEIGQLDSVPRRVDELVAPA